MYHLPFNDQTFETIICSEVLEHVSDVESALNEIDRLLKPGGKLLISVPSFLPEKICWLLSKDYQEMPGGHVRIFKLNDNQWGQIGGDIDGEAAQDHAGGGLGTVSLSSDGLTVAIGSTGTVSYTHLRAHET